MGPRFEKNLKHWRLFRRLTQQELAERAGVPRPNLVALEQGRRECTLTTLHRLAYALGISPGTLLDRLPPSPARGGLDRHQIDRIARSFLSEDRKMPALLQGIRNEAVLEAAPLLRASGLVVKSPVRKRSAALVSPKPVEQVLRRLTKLLPSSPGGPFEKG